MQRPVGTTSDAHLPIFVYIFGGGLTGGTANNEDLDAMVKMNGFVGVTMNYRLGARLARPICPGHRAERQRFHAALAGREAAGVSFAKRLGCDGPVAAACLHAKPVATLVDAQGTSQPGLGAC